MANFLQPLSQDMLQSSQRKILKKTTNSHQALHPSILQVLIETYQTADSYYLPLTYATLHVHYNPPHNRDIIIGIPTLAYLSKWEGNNLAHPPTQPKLHHKGNSLGIHGHQKNHNSTTSSNSNTKKTLPNLARRYAQHHNYTTNTFPYHNGQRTYKTFEKIYFLFLKFKI